MTPTQILILRHGEKLGDPATSVDGGINLSLRGSARAASLPQIFAPAQPLYGGALTAPATLTTQITYTTVAIPGAPPPFATPDFIFATQVSAHSNRPVETITPTATLLQLAIDDTHADKDFANLAQEILTNPKYAGKVVLVCWHHGKIPDLAAALGVTDPPLWDKAIFDRVWIITYPGGKASLENAPQQLLFGDSPT